MEMIPLLTHWGDVPVDPRLPQTPAIGVFGNSINRKLPFTLFSDRLELMNVTSGKPSK